MYFFDTHSHLHRAKSAEFVEIGEILHKGRSAGLRAVLAVSVERADWDFLPRTVQIPGVELYMSFGLHPYFVCQITEDLLRQYLEELKFYVANAPERMIAIGECGLDFIRARSEQARALQLEAFRAQLALARETGLPMTIHCVRAHGPMLELLRERPTPASAMHAFSGSAEVARQLVAAGHYISFAANLCVPHARKVVESARAVPETHLLIETDSPDQTPPQRHGAPNEPAFIVDIAARLAALRGVTTAQIAALTMANARRLFAIETPFALHAIDS